MNQSICGAKVEQFRGQMPVTERFAYFDNAAVAPISSPAVEAISQWMGESAREGDVEWLRWARRVEQIRGTTATLIGAEPGEIAFVGNTSAGLSLVAEGFPWKQGDNIVTLANEFPSNQYPWLNLTSRGVETRCVPVESSRVDLNRLADACDEKTRIVSVSWVGYATGYRLDPAEVADLAHDRGALLCLDAIQGLGVFPLDVTSAKIDFLAADGHKWLLGPEGAGVFFLRQEHLDLLRPTVVGWHSVENAHDFSSIDFQLRDEAARFEAGSQNMVGVLGMGASIDLLVETGLSPTTSTIAEQVLRLGDYACQRLTELGATIISDRTPNHASGIISFQLPGHDPGEVVKHCAAMDVILSSRHGWLRISPHGYNNEADIDRLIAAFASLPGSP